MAASTKARKLQLRQELSNLRQRDLSVADYTSKIKDICDSLASIEVNIEESEMVQVCLRGLASKFGAFRTVVCIWENMSSFYDLQSMLVVEENHAGASASTHTDNKMLYTERDRPRGRGRRASRYAMEAADEIKEGGTEMMPTAILDPPETGGVEAMRTGKGNPPRNAGTVARKATGRVSARRSVPIRREPDPELVLSESARFF